MALEVFTLEGIDPGSTDDSPAHRRLICLVRGGGKLGIWGEDGNTRNIDTVLEAVRRSGWPVTVKCETRSAGTDQATAYGHTRWVRQTALLEIVP